MMPKLVGGTRMLLGGSLLRLLWLAEREREKREDAVERASGEIGDHLTAGTAEDGGGGDADEWMGLSMESVMANKHCRPQPQ